jgi:hypothetical protein
MNSSPKTVTHQRYESETNKKQADDEKQQPIENALGFHVTIYIR